MAFTLKSIPVRCAYALMLVVVASWCVPCVAADNFPKVFNTEADGQHPPTAAEMVDLIELPTGFNVTLFAGEPDVQQPICMDFDDRGRLWVAECYSYSGGPYETKLRDRIVILEDTDGDGRHDKRTVFWDKGFMLTSLVWGYGGVWVLNDGTLSFLPDSNGDDVPDSDPVVMLDGWSKDCGHNFVSGLMWGPDGWMYGRHGIVDTSTPGIPGTPPEMRPKLNCSIWRYHPIHHTVEVVCNGTTNPWGLDYNQDGQFFMTNNVQGHLWHVIPGARFLRMYGQDFNPHAYELMDMTADHYHWDTKTKWNESRDGVANDLGGGHSHVGAMIYQGDNFPAAYRDKIFMCNTHGRRINVNRLDRQGSGYVGKREPDFMLVKNAWFRGVDIKIGPDDVMYVADWSDNGECHDHDGVHRTSGRIYRIAFGTPSAQDAKQLAKPAAFDLSRVTYDWLGRHQMRRALEAAAKGDLKLVTSRNTANAGEAPTRAAAEPAAVGSGSRLGVKELIASAALGVSADEKIAQAVQSSNAVVRAEGIQLAMQTAEGRRKHWSVLLQTGRQHRSANVLMAMISALQRCDAGERWQMTKAILSSTENAAAIAADNNLTLMTWYAIEPIVSNREALAVLDTNSKLQQFAVRRLAYEIGSHPEQADGALRKIADKAIEGDAESQRAAAQLLIAFKTGLAGRAKVDAPSSWVAVESRLRSVKNADVTLAVDSLAVMFGDGAALTDLRKMAANAQVESVAREQAIAALAQAKDVEAVPMLINLLGDRAVVESSIVALRAFDTPEIAKQLLDRFAGLKDGNKGRAIDTLASRQSYALELIHAIDLDKIDATELTAAQVRQLLALGHPEIKSVLEAKWGVIQETPEARLVAIENYRQQLTPERLSRAEIEKGAALFKTACATCHKIFGEGKGIAPDLTGANRTNLEYLLSNIVDPSAVVPKQFTTSIIVLNEGRVITGVVISETDQALVIQTDKEQLTVARDDIEAIKKTGKSLMPDGMLDTLSTEQIRDLFAFLMRP